MTGRIVIECGAAETRAAFLVGDEAVRFWFGPARGDEGAPRRPARGDQFTGRIRSVSAALGGAFIDIGVARDAFLSLKKNQEPLVEGALVGVIVRRPEIGDKGAVLALQDLPAGILAAAPGPAGDPVDAAIQAAAFVRPNAGPWSPGIHCDGEPATRVLRNLGYEVAAAKRDCFEEGADDALAAALEREVSLAGGARLIIDETEGLTVVDVDSSAAADGATGKLNDKVNLAAATTLPVELSRRGIGGRVVIDFLPPSAAPARNALAETLKRASRDLLKARIGRLSADGLLDLTLPREGYSLLEQATEPAGDWLRPGRRFTLDWQAKGAIRALERALRASPSARLRLVVGNGIADYLKERPQWSERVAAKFGARFAIEASEKIEERSFDIA